MRQRVYALAPSDLHAVVRHERNAEEQKAHKLAITFGLEGVQNAVVFKLVVQAHMNHRRRQLGVRALRNAAVHQGREARHGVEITGADGLDNHGALALTGQWAISS